MEASELVALRERLGWSQYEMARRLGISRSRLIDYERGYCRGHPPDASAAIPLHIALAVRYLVEHNGPPLSIASQLSPAA